MLVKYQSTEAVLTNMECIDLVKKEGYRFAVYTIPLQITKKSLYGDATQALRRCSAKLKTLFATSTLSTLSAVHRDLQVLEPSFHSGGNHVVVLAFKSDTTSGLANARVLAAGWARVKHDSRTFLSTFEDSVVESYASHHGPVERMVELLLNVYGSFGGHHDTKSEWKWFSEATFDNNLELDYAERYSLTKR